MIDIITLICTSVCGLLLGKHVENNQKLKLLFFRDLSKYITLLRINVSGRQLEMERFDKEFSQTCSKVFADFLSTGVIGVRLDKHQNQLVQDFLNSLAVSTSAELLKNLDYYQQRFAVESEYLERENKNGENIVKLGALLGVMLGILLI